MITRLGAGLRRPCCALQCAIACDGLVACGVRVDGPGGRACASVGGCAPSSNHHRCRTRAVHATQKYTKVHCSNPKVHCSNPKVALGRGRESNFRVAAVYFRVACTAMRATAVVDTGGNGGVPQGDKTLLLSRKVRSLLSRHVNRRPLLAQTKVRRACLASRRPWLTFSLDSAATCSSGAERKMELRPSVSHTQKRGRATASLATGGDGAWHLDDAADRERGGDGANAEVCVERPPRPAEDVVAGEAVHSVNQGLRRADL
eukprot:scaffold124639_cov77-Phaeocystis_antarctica.AAC.1